MSGRLELRGTDGEDRAALADLVRSAGEATVGERTTFRGHEVYLKGGPLRGASARRHGLRRWLLRRPPPRLREFDNLEWLHRRLFQVPRARAAAVLWRGGLPRYQALVTDWLPDHAMLDGFWAAATDDARAAVFDELAQEVARLHALGFVHRDLFPRNLLVAPASSARRIVFLDAWAGGPGPSRRGPATDVGALFLEGPWGTERWTERWLDAYAAGRAMQERPVDRGRLVTAARRERDRLRARLAREPERRGGRPLPPADWPATVDPADQNPTSQPT